MRFIQIGLIALLALPLFGAEPRVDPMNMGDRVICVVPMTGSGAYDDPKRPQVAPTVVDPYGNDVQGFIYEVTDDGQFAIVQFKAKDRKALVNLISDPRILKAFQKNKDSRGAIETELKKLKRNFDLEEFMRRMR